MKCSRCGAFIEDGMAFCRMCGAPVKKRRPPRKRKTGWFILIVILNFAVIISAGLAVKSFFFQNSAKDDISGEMKSIISETEDGLGSTDAESDEGEGIMTEESSKTADAISSKFHINSDTEEDYSRNLKPDQYAFYDSGISDFNFYYPTELYEAVKMNNVQAPSVYGTRLQKVHFTGSGGSELIFEVCRREDSFSLDTMRENVFQKESNLLSDSVTILNRLSEGETHGKVILSGYNSSSHEKAIYDMVKIEDGYILQMKVIYPFTPGDMENNRQQNYVVECLYRLCGFSDTSYESTRSYDEFCKSLKNN